MASRIPGKLKLAVNAFEKKFIEEALAEVGTREEIAARLGITRKNLWEKIRRHQIEAPSRDEQAQAQMDEDIADND